MAAAGKAGRHPDREPIASRVDVCQAAEVAGRAARAGRRDGPGADSQAPFGVCLPLVPEEESMAKVSWNKTWGIKMRKKSRRKKGKNVATKK